MGHRHRRYPPGPELSERALPGWRAGALAALSCAVGAGALAMAARGAPSAWIVVNLGASVLAALLAIVPWRRDRPLLLVAPLLVFATLLAGMPIEGVRRWVGLGPVALHVGMAVLPAFAVIAAHRPGPAVSVAGIVVAATLAVQPDRGTAIAFAAAMAIGTFLRPTRWSAISALCALLAVATTFIRPDPLAPVTHVEGVLQDLALQAWPLGMAAAVALMAAIAAPLRAGRDGAILAAFYCGLALASLIGPYPTPLLGYGVAPIIGYGLALGLIEGGRGWYSSN